MNVKILPYLFGIALLLISHIGVYYLSHKSGYNEAITEISKESALLVEQVRKEAEVDHAKQLHRIAEYEETRREELSKVSGLRQRLREVQARRADKVDGSLCSVSDHVDADIVRVFQSAIDSQSLQQAPGESESDAEKVPVTTYLLRVISEYNACSIQLNALIDEVKRF